MLIIRVAVPLVDGHVQVIRPVDQGQLLDPADDPAVARQGDGFVFLDIRVGPVAHDPHGVEHADAEDEVFHRFPGGDLQVDEEAFAGMEDVLSLPAAVAENDAPDLDLALAPALLAAGVVGRGLFGRRGLGRSRDGSGVSAVSGADTAAGIISAGGEAGRLRPRGRSRPPPPPSFEKLRLRAPR